jgi:sensitive to high expression protein 9
MQPLVARFAPRLVLEAVTFPSASRSLRLPRRQPNWPSTCLQCKFRIQSRRYADDAKSTTPPQPTKNVPRTVEDSLSTTIEDVPPKNLPSAEEGRRSAASKRFSHLMDNLQGNIFIASQRLNDLTGYSGIEALKARISALEARVQASQENVRSAREKYKTTVGDRASTQREVTTLLARKDSWTPSDLERFTHLYRMDHTNEQAVQEAATKLADAERMSEHASAKLSSSILARYHEEQIWSDKIRRMSTWGTWGLMGVNILLFFVFQFGFEPWRRARLVHGFEEKVREALNKEKMAHTETRDIKAGEASVEGIVGASVEELQAEAGGDTLNSVPAVDALVAAIREDVSQKEEEASLDIAGLHLTSPILQLRNPHSWKAALMDLFSERAISMRKQDITVVALEGAATGAAIVGIIATLVLRNS